jgi:hypothetical protein
MFKTPTFRTHPASAVKPSLTSILISSYFAVAF